jgi:hypothetical protein
MIKRLLAAAAPLVIAGAVPAALSLGGASAATLPLVGNVPNAALAPVSTVAGVVSHVTGSLFPASPVHSTRHAAGPSVTGHAPAGHASANGLKLNPLDTCVSCTGASAGPGSSQAGTKALRVLGNDLSAGDSSSNGAGSGALLALPANPLLSLALADWMTSAQADGLASSVSHARSALVDTSVGNGQVATLAILEGMSNANWNSSASHGDGATNGVDLTLLNGGLAVILLHSEASSDGTMNVYVASLNGTKLLSSDSGMSEIPISIPGIINLDLLQTGADGGLATAALGGVSNLLGMTGPVAGVLATDAAGSPLAAAPAAPVAASAGSGTGIHSAAGVIAKLRVPMTGISVGMAGFALLFGGLSVVFAALRRRSGAGQAH